MKLPEAIRKAVETQDGPMAGRIADVLRFRFGFDYEQVLERFHAETGLDRAEFDGLMYEADREEGQG